MNSGVTRPEITAVPSFPGKAMLIVPSNTSPRLYIHSAEASVSRVSVRVSVCDEIRTANERQNKYLPGDTWLRYIP